LQKQLVASNEEVVQLKATNQVLLEVLQRADPQTANEREAESKGKV